MFWESKHKGKDFVKNTYIILFYVYVQTNIAHIVANNEN